MTPQSRILSSLPLIYRLVSFVCAFVEYLYHDNCYHDIVASILPSQQAPPPAQKKPCRNFGFSACQFTAILSFEVVIDCYKNRRRCSARSTRCVCNMDSKQLRPWFGVHRGWPQSFQSPFAGDIRNAIPSQRTSPEADAKNDERSFKQRSRIQDYRPTVFLPANVGCDDWLLH